MISLENLTPTNGDLYIQGFFFHFFSFFPSKSLRLQILFHFVCPVQSVFSLFTVLWKHNVRFSMRLNLHKPALDFSLMEVVIIIQTLLTVCPCFKTVTVTKMSFIIIPISIWRHWEDESSCWSHGSERLPIAAYHCLGMSILIHYTSLWLAYLVSIP